jgi:thiol:disulfide interchange protein
MRIPFCRLAPALGVATLLALAAASPAPAAEVPKGSRPDIYDETLDGNKQLAEAEAAAAKDGKLVLIQFGANWCGWCHKLHHLFDTDKEVSAELKAHYILVLVDVNKSHNGILLKQYGAQQMGLPSLVVLDAAGKHLTTKNTGELEEGDHHSPAKVIEFLKKWAPKG